MQKSWRDDADKLTFIICLEAAAVSTSSDHSAEIASMIGDVNMFVSCHEEADGSISLVGELELMIASRNFQRKGYGRAALLCFLSYVKQHEKLIVQQFLASDPQQEGKACFDYLAAKIGESNERSLHLFESLGFVKTTTAPNYFDEFELRLYETSEETLVSHMGKHNIQNFAELRYQASSNVGKTSLNSS